MPEFPFMCTNHWVQWYQSNNLLDPAGGLQSAEVMVEVLIRSNKINPAELIIDDRGTMVTKARLIDPLLTEQFKTALRSELQGVRDYVDLNCRVAAAMERMRKSLQSGVLRNIMEAIATPVAFGYTSGGLATR